MKYARQISRRSSPPARVRSKRARSKKAYSSRLLDRSVLLLRILAAGSVEKRLADFSETGLHKSTAFRLLEALRRHRLVGPRIRPFEPQSRRAYRLVRYSFHTV